jgi:hypothetical protein
MAIQKLEKTLDADDDREECFWVSFKIWVCVFFFFLFRRVLLLFVIGSYIRVNTPS